MIPWNVTIRLTCEGLSVQKLMYVSMYSRPFKYFDDNTCIKVMRLF